MVAWPDLDPRVPWWETAMAALAVLTVVVGGAIMMLR